MILLSICIPTYNRADILKKSLESYVTNPHFDEEVEIIISDNASTDNTKEVGEYFSSKYSNILYFRNTENIRDRNFPLSLDRGTGKYLKLMKDNLVISDDGLSYMKDCVKKNEFEESPLFFTNGILFNSNELNMYYCRDMDDFITHLSFYVTAVWVFGCWKTEWPMVADRTKYSALQLAQNDWFYQLVVKKGNAVLCKKPFVKETIEVGSRSGYNWFKVHVSNYYLILEPYINSGKISKKALKKEKETYLKNLLPFIALKYVWNTRPYYNFDMSGSTKILWKHFKTIPLFYILLITLPIWGSYYSFRYPAKKIIMKMGLLAPINKFRRLF